MTRYIMVWYDVQGKKAFWYTSVKVCCTVLKNHTKCSLLLQKATGHMLGVSLYTHMACLMVCPSISTLYLYV